MSTVRSKDGTTIAFDRKGSGPPVILVDGALCYREMGPMKALADVLSEHYTVFTYDRRGRGESGDTPPYAVEREVEDVAALIAEAGGSAYVCGISSGGALALDAAASGLAIDKLALYETPFVVDDSRPPMASDYRGKLDAALAADRRADAVRLFMRRVGVPRPVVALMRFMPAWAKLKATAHTLAYDDEVLGDTGSGKPLPADRWASVSAPTLALDGGKSPEWMRTAMEAVANLLPDARHGTLPGQTHMVKAKVLGPALHEFFAAPAPSPSSNGRQAAGQAGLMRKAPQ
jgi:pimeloyl-ACP methyl ester carboxylesterase